MVTMWTMKKMIMLMKKKMIKLMKKKMIMLMKKKMIKLMKKKKLNVNVPRYVFFGLYFEACPNLNISNILQHTR